MTGAGGELAFTFLACADLKRICEGLATPTDRWGGTAAEAQAVADDFARKFAHHCTLVAANPEVGPAREELRHGIRSTIFQKYAIYYRVRGERVEVLRVLRAGQDTPPG